MSHRSQQTVRGPRAKLQYVATETATVRDSDGEIQIVAGRSHVSADSDLLRRYPQHFTLVDSLPARKNTNTGKTDAAARREPVDPEAIPGELPRPSWSLGIGPGLLAAGEVELRKNSKSPVVVHITRHTRDQIDQEARAVPRGFETGGLLLKRRSFDSTRAEITEAWGPGPDAHLAPNAMSLNWGLQHLRARRLADATDNRVVAGGFWHVHPVSHTPIPSEQDLRMFSAAMAHADATVWPLEHYVGLIATEVGRRWVGPDLTAWVVRRRQSWGDDLVCEPAVIA